MVATPIKRRRRSGLTDYSDAHPSASDPGSWVSNHASGGWYFHSLRVADYAALTSTVQVGFIASDQGAGSIVEAVIDDFQANDTGCSACPGDVNGDGVVDISDLGVLLSNFGSGSATLDQGDLDGDGDTDVSDLGTLLANFRAKMTTPEGRPLATRLAGDPSLGSPVCLFFEVRPAPPGGAVPVDVCCTDG